MTGKFLEARELVPLAHVPRHQHQDGGQHRQWNIRRERCGDQNDREQRQRVNDSGDWTDRAGFYVGHGARDGAGRRNSAEKRSDEVGHALRHQFLIGIVPVVDQFVGDARAQQRFDCAEKRDRHRRCDQFLDELPRECRQLERGQLLRYSAELAADGFDRYVKQRHDGRGEYQRHDRSRNVPDEALPPGDDCRRRKSRPEHHHCERARRDCHRVRVDRAKRAPDQLRLLKKISRHAVDRKPQKILQLRQDDQHRDAVGKADDDRHRNEAHQIAKPSQSHREQQYAGTHRRDQQVGETVLRDDSVNDHHEGAGRPADLHTRATERGDQKSRDDRGEKSLLGFRSAGDTERHGKRQCNDADGHAGRQILDELGAVVAA